MSVGAGSSLEIGLSSSMGGLSGKLVPAVAAAIMSGLKKPLLGRAAVREARGEVAGEPAPRDEA
jgi:hypothetical protein